MAATEILRMAGAARPARATTPAGMIGKAEQDGQCPLRHICRSPICQTNRNNNTGCVGSRKGH
jgi:hypothetical protein